MGGGGDSGEGKRGEEGGGGGGRLRGRVVLPDVGDDGAERHLRTRRSAAGRERRRSGGTGGRCS